MIAGREIALSVLTVLDAAPPAVVDTAAAAGFDSVTLRVEGELIGDTPTRRETIARLRHHGLGVLDVEVVRLRADTDAATLRPMLESAAALGARHVLVIAVDEDEAAIAERFAALCAEANEFGVRPVLEFMVFSGAKTVEQAHRIVQKGSDPFCTGGVLVDPLHLARSGGTPADVAALASADVYPYAQLCDAPLGAPDGDRALYREAVDDRRAPGEGELPLAALLDALPAGIPLSVETPVKSLAGRPPGERARHAMEATRRLLS